MRIDALAMGLVLTAAISGCGESGSRSESAVRDAEGACARATALVTAQRGLPVSHVASCDPIAEADAPAGYFVLALHARCPDELCGSTNMGWFAVQKATADVFEVDDVADWTIGRRLTVR